MVNEIPNYYYNWPKIRMVDNFKLKFKYLEHLQRNPFWK